MSSQQKDRVLWNKNNKSYNTCKYVCTGWANKLQGGKICRYRQWLCFKPIAVETLGVFNSCAPLLLNEIVKRISVNTGEIRNTTRSFYLNVSRCWWNILVSFYCTTLPAADCTACFLFVINFLGGISTEGLKIITIMGLFHSRQITNITNTGVAKTECF